MRHTIPMTRTEAKLLVDEFCYEYGAIMTGLQHRYIVEALCGEPISMADAGRMSGRTFAVIALAIICATRCGEKVCVVSSNVISAQLAFEQLVQTLQKCEDSHAKQLIKVRGSSRSVFITGGFAVAARSHSPCALAL